MTVQSFIKVVWTDFEKHEIFIESREKKKVRLFYRNIFPATNNSNAVYKKSPKTFIEESYLDEQTFYKQAENSISWRQT